MSLPRLCMFLMFSCTTFTSGAWANADRNGEEIGEEKLLTAHAYPACTASQGLTFFLWICSRHLHNPVTFLRKCHECQTNTST